MGLQSMTGFARATAELAGTQIAWEIKSVNGKSAEARFRLPPGLDRLEPAARQALQKRFSRGNFQASLTLVRTAAEAQPVVNEAFLTAVAELAQSLEQRFGCAPATADGLLSLRGVLDASDAAETDENRAALDERILQSFGDALSGLESTRAAEGEALGRIAGDLLDRIETLTLQVEADRSRDPQVIRERLREQVRLLMDVSAGLDEARLHGEAAFLATKADVREEIDRLKTHVASARALLDTGGPVGRKLDFLAQEFNRESNTLCSKSNASSVTAIGLELKSVVDQLREQVQNLE